MDNKMFCFQCEQTLNGKGCTGNAGVCGKNQILLICRTNLLQH